MSEKRVPFCGKCREHHYGFQNCPAPAKPGEARLGTSFGRPWGTAKQGAQVVYTLPARPRTGRLTGPDGNVYEPPPAA